MVVDERDVLGSTQRRLWRLLRQTSSLEYLWERARIESGLPELTAAGMNGSEVEMFADPSNQLGGEAEQAGQRSLRTKTLP
jgi:hypothetical protein